LAFLERDMLQEPAQLTPFSAGSVAALDQLLEGVSVRDDELLPDDVTF